MKRVFLIVLDSFGIGALPDSKIYGDEAPNTLKAIYSSPEFNAPNLEQLGLFNIDGITVGKKAESPSASFARLGEASKGKDTTTGHWEIAGIISEHPFPTFPDGFPEDLIKKFEQETGRSVICNKVYSGTEVIKDYGKEHMESDSLIVYTSADSVFQIAAHESIVPVEELYRYSEIARSLLFGDYAVGRVIARPFSDIDGKFVRTANRKDFSLKPTGRTILDELKDNRLDVIGVGKISDIFDGEGLTESIKTHSNEEGMEVTKKLLQKNFNGLAFVNLVDFDMLYGHRNDVDGYAAAISCFDSWLGDFLPMLNEDDVLMITADHGCDPSDESTDHTREYVPLLLVDKSIPPSNLGTKGSFACIAATIAKYFNLNFNTKDSLI